MDRVLLLLPPTDRRDLLADWLSTVKAYDLIIGDNEDALANAFDLCILDEIALSRYQESLRKRKQSDAPAFLPILLVIDRPDIQTRFRHARHVVDELIVRPIEKAELHARVAILLRMRRLSIDNVTLHHQLGTERAHAGEIQHSLLPGTSLAVAGFDIAARCRPARDVGGDFYDWQVHHHDSVTITVADVAGKGMAAALLTVTVRATLRALHQLESPAAVVNLAASELSRDFERAESFVTLFHAKLNLAEKRMTYVDAGHGHAFIRRATGAVEVLPCRGYPFGAFPDTIYHEGSLQFYAGDTLVIHSDGLIETRKGEETTPPMLAALLDGASNARDQIDRLLAFSQPVENPPDDITVMVVRCE